MAEVETRFHLRAAETRVGRIALVTADNGADWKSPTTFGRSAFASLISLLPELESGDWQGLVLTGKPLVFAAGADLDAFPALSTPDLAREAARVGHEAFGRLRALPYPTLAAINGACVGGGLEIALHCDHRVAADSARHLGFPEVGLGIVPAWGGSTLAPRLVGARAAVELIVLNPLKQNRLIDAARALELGLVDAVLPTVEFLDDALSWLTERIETGDRPRAEADLSDAAEVVRRARHQVDDQVHGAALAPYRALALIEGAATTSVEEGYRAEEDALADLLPGPQAQASVYAYGLIERRVRRGVGIPEAQARPVRCVGIVGAGLMATQLATLFVRRLEVPVVLTDVDPSRVESAVAGVGKELARQVERGRLPETKARFLAGLVGGGEGLDRYAGCDLVLEAVFEEIGMKQRVFHDLEAVVDPGSLLLTNTSALSVTEMAERLEHPGRVAGMHFFNPVAVLPLVELVRTSATDDATLRTVWEVTGRLGKRGVLVSDSPGFVVNRLLTRMFSVLLQALERGSSLEDTDAAALRLGLPMPPSMLLAMVGPRVANHVLETLHGTFPDRFPLSPTLANFASGEEDIVRTSVAPAPIAEIHDSLLEALADEVAHLLDEQVVGSAEDVDTCMILGAGWPLFLGGISRYLDTSGVSERVTGAPLAGRRPRV
jgi:3-hydroxyacyl-CoA dehydrogenase/enoyl-CoA hydratase/carnithine racemase